MAEEPLKLTPLHEEHVRLHARMVPFAGWDMPVQYKSIIQEHRAVRSDAGVFDVSHMGEFEIAGSGAFDFLQFLTVNDLATLEVNHSQYSCFLRPDGGILDDIVIYHLPDHFLVVVNASNVGKIGRWLDEHARPNVTVSNVSDSTALIAIQGPRALGIVQPLAGANLSTISRFGIVAGTYAGIPCLIGRTGYTGEDGVEIFCSTNDAVGVWRATLYDGTDPIQPCGLGARDTLRLESSKLLYGHDMDETTNPLAAGLNFIVKFDKGDFIGRDALLDVRGSGPRQRLIGFEMVERGIPRADCPIYVDGEAVGRVTSGSFAPTIEKNIGLGYVESSLATVGQRLDVIIRGAPVQAKVVKLPFYRSKKRPVSP